MPSNLIDEYAQVLSFSLRQLGANITEGSLHSSLMNEGFMDEHDLFRALKVLGEYGVKQTPMQLENISFEALSDIPAYSLLYLNDGSFVTFEKLMLSEVAVYSAKERRHVMEFNELKSMWNGVFIALDTEHAIVEPEFEKERTVEVLQKIQYPAFAAVAVFIMLFSLVYAFSNVSIEQRVLWQAVVGINLVGALVSLIMAKFYIDDNQDLLSRVCGTDIQNSCLKILDDKDAKLFSIPYADIGFTFFMGNIMLLVFTSSFPTLLVVNASVAILYSFYSIYYQSVIAKAWCKLCLVVQALLVVQAGLLWLLSKPQGYLFSDFSDINNLPMQGVVFVLPALVWTLIRQRIENSKNALAWEMSARKALFNPVNFELYRQSLPTVNNRKMVGDIVLSPEVSTTDITVILSMKCPQCGVIFKQFVALANSNAWAANFTFRISSVGYSEGMSEMFYWAHEVSKRVVALSARGDTQGAIRAVESWFEEHQMLEFEQWLSEQDVFSDEELSNADNVLMESGQWFSDVGGTSTPTIYLDNKPIPKEYLTREADIVRVVLSGA
jgi:uncharacterized membrane protein